MVADGVVVAVVVVVAVAVRVAVRVADGVRVAVRVAVAVGVAVAVVVAVKGQIARVRHAYGFLEPGGTLVAVMGAGWTFRQDRRATEFQEWLVAIGGSIGTEKVGTRVYVTGNTYPVKDRLKAAGCHWDGERRQWWIGAAKQAAIAAIVGGLDGHPAPKEDLSTRRVYGKVRYKDRSYYVIGQGNSRLRLTVLDASIDFWADEAACQWEKRYAPREYRGRTEYQTLGGIQRFVARAKSDPGSVRPSSEHVRCRHCGEWTLEGDDWCMVCGKADYER